MRDDERELNYIKSVGHEPRNLPDDHPDLWQWVYSGKAAERERLLERLSELELFPVGQPALF